VKLIYVSGPYTAGNGRSVEANMAAAIMLGGQIRGLGYTPMVPHIAVLPFRPGDNPWKSAVREALTMLRRCDALVVLSNWMDSRGARMEVWMAKRWGIPVLDLEDLMECHRTGRTVAV